MFRQVSFFILTLWLLGNQSGLWAGDFPFPAGTDSTRMTAAIDTNRLLSDQPLKSPTGAMLRSAVLPGWGQWYNEQYWKAPLALAVNSFLVYQVLNYHHRWRETGNRDFQERRNLFTWYLGVAYALTLVDAYVDAYLYKFDEAMEIGQLLNYENHQWQVGLSFSYHF